MTIYEVFKNGRKKPVDVVENYKSDLAKWGRRVANHNALLTLRHMAGLEAPLPTCKEAIADLRSPGRLNLSELAAE